MGAAGGRGGSRGAERPTNRLPVSHPCSVVRVRSWRYARSVWLLARARRRRRRRRLDVVVRQAAARQCGPNAEYEQSRRTASSWLRQQQRTASRARILSSSAFLSQRRGVDPEQEGLGRRRFPTDAKGEWNSDARTRAKRVRCSGRESTCDRSPLALSPYRDTRIPLGSSLSARPWRLNFEATKGRLGDWVFVGKERLRGRRYAMSRNAKVRDKRYMYRGNYFESCLRRSRLVPFRSHETRVTCVGLHARGNRINFEPTRAYTTALLYDFIATYFYP